MTTPAIAAAYTVLSIESYLKALIGAERFTLLADTSVPDAENVSPVTNVSLDCATKTMSLAES